VVSRTRQHRKACLPNIETRGDSTQIDAGLSTILSLAPR